MNFLIISFIVLMSMLLVEGSNARCSLGSVVTLRHRSGRSFDRRSRGGGLGIVLSVRGGATSATTDGVSEEEGGGVKKKKKKKKKRSKETVEEEGVVAATAQQGNDGKKQRKKGKKSVATSVATKVEEEKQDKKANEGKKAINDAMRHSDHATALGDAIRDRADILRADPIPTSTSDPSSSLDPYTSRIDASLESLGLALGTSDELSARRRRKSTAPLSDQGKRHREDRQQEDDDDDEGGGVEVSPGAVLANYFLQSHGGMHGIQCLTSLLSVMAGLAALFVPAPIIPSDADANGQQQPSNMLKLILIRRSLLCALAKHMSGLLAATTLSARRIPSVGLSNTRKKIAELALDPVAQYSFYCALLLLWMPTGAMTMTATTSSSKGGKEGGTSGTTEEAAATTQAKATYGNVIPWYLQRSTAPFPFNQIVPTLLGPILLREIVSTLWVTSDVLVILSSSSSSGSSSSNLLLRLGRNVVNALMNLLFTPTQWQNATSAQRQKLLAKLISKMSLTLELLTGVIILIDAMKSFMEFSLSPTIQSRPPLPSVVKKVLCARFYLNFLLVRRKKIRDLVNTIRGGARYVPGRVLDALLEPKRAMGLSIIEDRGGGGEKGGGLVVAGNDEENDDDGRENNNVGGSGRRRKWLEYATLILDLED